jgi:hypothetical protein
VADAGRDQVGKDLDGDGKEAILLSGVGSYDQDAGLIKSWTWTLNGELLAESFAPTVELPTGSHRISLKITDEQGAEAADQVTVTVR